MLSKTLFCSASFNPCSTFGFLFGAFLVANVVLPLFSFIGFLLWAAPVPIILFFFFFLFPALNGFHAMSPCRWFACGPQRRGHCSSKNDDELSVPAAPLSPGTRGPAVAQLQDIVIKLGHLHPCAVSCGFKGTYGPNTSSAIAKLQQANGQSPTGVFDSATRAQLQAALKQSRQHPVGESSVPAAPLSPGSRGSAVAQLQDVLIKLGHLHPSGVRFGKGMYGPFTTKAVAKLQQANGQSPTGAFDSATRAQLQAALKQSATTASSCFNPPTEEPVCHWDIICDKTNQPIVGVRYHKTGEDYDLCEAEFQKLSPLDQAAFERIEKPQKPRCFQAAFPLFRFVQYPTDTVMARSTPEEQLQPAAASDAEVAETAKADVPEFPSPPLYVDTVAANLAADVVDSPTLAAVREEQLEDQVKADQRVALLISMGFTAEEVEGALEATRGSLERAADWLFAHRQTDVEPEPEPEPAFLPEWELVLRDLVEMGFQEEHARKQVLANSGDIKQAIKALVQIERVLSQ